MKIKTSLVAVAALLVFAAVGCGEAERTYDCAQICSRYSSCFDEDLDETKCTDACEDKGDADKDFEAKADACEGCLEDNESCASGTAACTDECAEVVVVSVDGSGGSGGAN
jgi:hypothetical protein